MKIIKVKILRAGLSTYWYANRIGEVFEVYNEFQFSSSYSIPWVQGQYEIRLIDKEDCMEIKDFISQGIKPFSFSNVEMS